MSRQRENRNEANEYAEINSTAVQTNEAGSLTDDEDGRHYVFDERNRLTEVHAAGGMLLCGYYLVSCGSI